MPDLSNNTAQTAKLLPIASGLPATVSGDLSSAQGGDLVDFYKFTTTASSNLRLALTGLTGNASIAVFSASNGEITATLASPGTTAGDAAIFDNTGNLSEAFVFNNLPAGEYIVQVSLPNGVTAAQYDLEALASRDAISNTLLWQQSPTPATAPVLAYWQLNGRNVTGQVSATATENTNFAGLEFAGVGDFDGDNTQDVLWTKPLDGGGSNVVIWYMNPDNTLRESRSLLFGGDTPFALDDSFEIKHLGDFSGDGRTDILLRQTGQGVAVIWEILADAQIGSNSKAYTGFPPSYELAAIGDFNGDNRQDVVLTNGAPGGGVVGIWMFDESLNLVLPNPETNPNAAGESGAIRLNGEAVSLGTEWKILGVGDFNKGGAGATDDRDDLVWVNENTGQLVTWLMNGSEITKGSLLANGVQVTGTPGAFNLVGLGDLDGDLNDDLVWRGKNNEGFIYNWKIENGEVNLAASAAFQFNGADFALSSIYEIIATQGTSPGKRLVDYDGDKKVDLFLRDNQGVTGLWAMDGNTIDAARTGAITTPDGAIPSVPTIYDAVGGLQTELTGSIQSTAGDSISTAFNIGVLEGTGNYQDAVVSPGSDYFKFKLERSTDITIDLFDQFGSTTPATANYVLTRQDGVNPDGSPQETVINPNSLSQPLQAGTYFIKVSSTASLGQQVNYNLKVSGDPNVVNLRGVAITSVTPSNATFNGTNGAIRLADLGSVPSSAPDSDKPKASVDINYTISNTEVSAAGDVTVRFYLSRVSTITPGDALTVQLGDRTVNVGANTNAQDIATFELPPGDNNFWTTDTNYYIGYEIDPVSAQAQTGAIVETDETDNINLGLNVDVKEVAIENTQTPDLTGAQLIASASTITKGGAITLNYTARNAGKKSTGSISTPPPEVSVRFYLYRGPANQLDTTDDLNVRELVLSQTTPAQSDDLLFLPANIDGETNAPAQELTLDLPGVNDAYWGNSPAGTQFFIGIVYDTGNAVAESSETNNSNVGLGVDSVAFTLA